MAIYVLIIITSRKEFLISGKDNERSSLEVYFIYKYPINFPFSTSSYLSLCLSFSTRVRKEV
jgi:hypothetical protein